MAKRFEITHEAEDDTFNLQMNNNNIRFIKKNYLYTYRPSTQYMKTIQCLKKKRNNNNKMKTRSHTTRSKQPMMGISNLCLTHADANKSYPFNQSCFAVVPDSIGDPSDDETNGNATDYYDNEDDNYFANM